MIGSAGLVLAGIVLADTEPFGSGPRAAMAESFSDLQQKAATGDVPAQRKLADCNRTGCPELASPDPVLACAWRIVIVAGGGPQATPADTEARRRDCESLEPPQQAAAAREAKAIFSKVHGRELVLPADFFGGPRLAPRR